MKYWSHKAEAIAICSFCGLAVCDTCAHFILTERSACSEHNAKASAFYSYLCGALFAIAAVSAWFMLPSPFLILFTGGCAVALTASDVWYGRIAGEKSGPSSGTLSRSRKSDSAGTRGASAHEELGAAAH